MVAWNGHLPKCLLCPRSPGSSRSHVQKWCRPIVRHNALRDTFLESCKQACIGGHLEAGSSLDEEGRKTRPADFLVQNWEFGKPAALDFTVTSPLNPTTLNGASVTAGSAASAAEARKHATNDAKCNRLGWVCIPLAVETYGCWGDEVSTDSLRVSLLARLAQSLRLCRLCTEG